MPIGSSLHPPHGFAGRRKRNLCYEFDASRLLVGSESRPARLSERLLQPLHVLAITRNYFARYHFAGNRGAFSVHSYVDDPRDCADDALDFNGMDLGPADVDHVGTPPDEVYAVAGSLNEVAGGKPFVRHLVLQRGKRI